MNNILSEMLKKYEVGSPAEQKNAIKEIMQEIVLCGLSRAGFFKHAAFYGGTALRIFYGLDRFSEDLDFSLMAVDESFQFSDYFPILEKELASFGLKVTVFEKEKSKDSGVRSAFLKGNTKEHILMFYSDDVTSGIASNDTIKIKFEVDIFPPTGANFECIFKLLPAPYEITLYDMPSLFAGKLHAVICRAWKSRVKGRDLYDLIFYISHRASINLPHLKARLVESKAWDADKELCVEDVKKLLIERFETIDFERAKDDVRPFVKDVESLDLWSTDFFRQIVEELLP